MLVALVLVAHGSLTQQWAKPFEILQKNIQEQHPEKDVVLSFLQLMSPDVMQAVEQLYCEGCRAVKLWPLFLGLGSHMTDDIPTLLAQIQETYPDMKCEVLPALAEDEQILRSLVQRGIGFLES